MRFFAAVVLAFLLTGCSNGVFYNIVPLGQDDYPILQEEREDPQLDYMPPCVSVERRVYLDTSEPVTKITRTYCLEERE